MLKQTIWLKLNSTEIQTRDPDQKKVEDWNKKFPVLEGKQIERNLLCKGNSIKINLREILSTKTPAQSYQLSKQILIKRANEINFTSQKNN